MRIAMDLGLFEKLADNEGRAKNCHQLAASTGAGSQLIGMWPYEDEHQNLPLIDGPIFEAVL